METIRKLEAGSRRPSKQIAQRLATALLLPPDEHGAFLAAARGVAAAPALATLPVPVGAADTLPRPTEPARVLPVGTMTLLMTDLAGSTHLLYQLGARYDAVLAAYRQLLRAVVAQHGGQEVDTRGDSFFVVFARGRDAVVAAVAAQRAVAGHPWPDGAALSMRMGLHTGEPRRSAEGYVGLDVVRTARLMAAGHGGQVLLSEATRAVVERDLPEGVDVRDLGWHHFKDLPHPERVFQLVVVDLPADFPALQTRGSGRHNLGVQRDPLIGRHAEVAAVRALLLREDVGLVTLTGPGGIGKTRLALQVGADLLDAFADGVFVVNLAPITDADLVAPTIAQVVGAQEIQSQSLLDSLQNFLREKAMLLVLDNFEQVGAAALVVAALLAAAPGLKVLITSRVVLHLQAEHEYPVPPLALPDLKHLPAREALAQYAAVALFIQRAQAVQPDFQLTDANAPAVTAICQRLDGLPLAIVLAAARTKLLPAQALLSRLTNRFEVLTGGSRDLPARQQTLRSTIDWSYQLLDAQEQKLFARLAVFVGGCSLEAAEVICSADGKLGIELVGGLQSLLDNSLLDRADRVGGDPRFIMLETIRAYALERLTASGEELALQHQHASFFLAMAEQAEPTFKARNQGRWLERLDAELDNLRSVLHWSMTAAGEALLGLRLAGALRIFWEIREYWSEGRAWQEWFLTHTPAEDAWLAARAKALTGAGRLALKQGDLDVARLLLEEALVRTRALADTARLPYALSNFGTVKCHATR